MSLKTTLRTAFREFQNRLAYHDALPQLVVLGIISGIAASLLIVAFRWLVENASFFMLAGTGDGFESLSLSVRFLLPLSGALLIGVALHFVSAQDRSVSVTHVLDRLHNHQGKLPVKNILVQFLGGFVALVSGQSVGREGPAIHLGAGIASLLGQWWRLTNNSLRTLVACGSAAGIAASFNTPMAGVVFAMEVILMEYTVVGFVPVIIASVVGATTSQLVFGSDINFMIAASEVNVLLEMPYMVFCGLVFSVAAAGFIRLHLAFFQLQSYSIVLRLTFTGLVTGAVAVFVPQIMGTGYDTLNAAMLGNIGVWLLILIVLAKLVVTAMATGMGMVGGLIGPSLVIGGCLGGLLGILGNVLVPSASDTDYYVAIGMVAMMGAVLNAPLAALVAILELSNSPGIIFPSMLTVVVACLGVQHLFKYKGIFAEQLKIEGLNLSAEAGKGFLSRIGVRSVMNSSFLQTGATVNWQQAQELVESNQFWSVVNQAEREALLPTAELARLMDEKTAAEEAGEDINLADLSEKMVNTGRLDSLANLQEASSLISSSGAEALLVLDSSSFPNYKVIGVITRETIMNYYGM